MSAYFARLAASHGAPAAPSTARAANPAAANVDTSSGNSISGTAAIGDPLPEVDAVVDVMPSPGVSIAIATQAASGLGAADVRPPFAAMPAAAPITTTAPAAI